MNSATAGRVRGVAAGVLGVLAVLLLVASGIAVWARATLFDSDKVASIASNVFADPAVDEALAERMTEYVFAAVDANAIVDTVLPDQLDRLQPTIVAGMESAVDRTLTRILESNAGQELLTNVVRRAHAAAMELLQGDGLVDGVSVVEGEVTINLLPLVGRGLTRIQDFGLLDDVELPTITADGDPDEQIADLEAALGRDLPDDFGQLVVYRSDRLADAQAAVQSAQQLLVTVKRALWVLLIAAVVSLVLTIVLARDRWRAILLLGLGTFVATVAARTAVRNVRDDAPELVERPGAKAAVTVVLDDLSAGLLRMFGLLLLVAVALTAIAFFQRRHRRDDLLLIGSVVAGVVVVVLLGLSIVTLIVGVLVGVAVAVGVPRLLPTRSPASPAAT